MSHQSGRACAAVGLLLIHVVWLLGPVGCRPPNRTVSESHSAAAIDSASAERIGRPEVAATRFQLVPATVTGIDLINRVVPDHPMRRLYHSGFVCGGVAIGDVTGDGRPDVYLVSGEGSNRLYENLGDFRFRDVTEQAGVGGGDAWGSGAVLIDIDNDGDLDLYVCNYDSPNLLYINRGEGRFEEQGQAWGLDIVDACLTASFCDYDRDGDLDVYLLNNRYYQEGGRPAKPPWAFRDGQPYVLEELKRYYALMEVSPGRYTIDDYGRPDYFLRNNGNGTFSDATSEVGIAGTGYGLSATWWDFNSDGWPDIYVCNDFNDPDRLYHNNGDGTFTNVIESAVPHMPWFSMGSDAGDINNDGLIDLLCVDMSATNHFKQKTTMGEMNAKKLAEVAGPPPQYMRNAVYLNTGTNRFMEIAYLASLANSDWSWSAKIADLDNDGWQDVFISNGMIRSFNDSDTPFDTQMLIGRTRWDIYKDQPKRPEQNLAFRNAGNLAFEDISAAWGLDHVGISYGTGLADLDGDQDLDLIIVNVDEPISVYRNNSTEHRLTISLEGTTSNRYGLGARLEIETKDGILAREMFPHRGFLSCDEPLVHFGLGDRQQVDLVVHWPSGKRQIVRNLRADRHYRIREEETSESIAAQKSPAPIDPMFARHAATTWSHRELEFDDFHLQPLLPNRLSQLGPGTAWADVDGDGDEDGYVGGAAGQPGVLLINDGHGRLDSRPLPALTADARHEDMGCIFLDVDADDDFDLYVVSGGVEGGDQAGQFEDRLYLNSGQGSFERAAPERLPTSDQSGSVVAAADFDRDGDLDLFIGGRVIPGDYPLAPLSRLLRNEGGCFVDITDQLAPSMRRCGLVTSALWTDVDADGWCELLVCHEWGPVRLFHNERGRLVDKTAEAGLEHLTGWWNGLAAGDLDGDEDMDYVVTNFGLNTKYHASEQNPALLYYGNFENTGRMHLVEAEFEDDKLYPIRGKSCSTLAMPFLADKFSTYRQFALADLSQLYSDRCLEQAQRFEARELQSVILLNDGSGRFQFRPLPRLAQVAPAFGVVVSELTGDFHPDVYLVHNFFGPQPETGHMDGGLSLLLRGQGDGTFLPVWPRASGLEVNGDAKGLAVSDLNRDGRLNLVITRNNDQPLFFCQHTSQPPITVRLLGASQNRCAVGARVTVRCESGHAQTAEVAAGGSYLSQSTSTLFFGGADQVVTGIDIVWPDGQRSHHLGEAGRRQYVIQQPSHEMAQSE